MRFSIVIPMYNAQDYIVSCVQSLLDQNFDSMQIVCVDDGSQDNTSNVLKSNFGHLDKIILVHQENQGPAKARNTGVENASGEYIFFVDSDDKLKPGVIEQIDAHLKVYQSDIVSFGLNRIDATGTTLMTEQLFETGEITIQEALVKFSPSVWNKVFSRDVISKVKFPVGILYEDMTFTSTVLAMSNKISCCELIGYDYLQRDGSIMNSFNERVFDIFEAVDQLVKNYKNNLLYEKYFTELSYTVTMHLVLGHLSRCALESSRAKRKQYCYDVYSYMTTHFSNYDKNPYLKKTHNDSLILKLMKSVGIKAFSKQKFYLILDIYRIMMKFNLVKLKRW